MLQTTHSDEWTLRRVVIVLTLIASQVASIATIILGPQSLPVIDREFDTNQGSWFVTSELLASAVLCPLFARLSDLYGKRRLAAIALLSGGLGSLLVAVAPTFSLLLVGRAMQGTLIVCCVLGAAIVRESFPAKIAPVAVGLAVTGAGLPGSLVPFVTGPLMDSHGYQGVFLALAVVVAAAGVVLLLVVPESPVAKEGSVDFVGAFLLGSAVASLLAGVSLGATVGWTSPLVVALIVVGVCLGVGWILSATKKADPLIDIRILADRRVANRMAAGGLIAGTGTLFLIISALVAESGSERGFGFGLNATQYAFVQCLFFFGFFVGGVVPVRAVRRYSFGIVQSILTVVLLISSAALLLAVGSLPLFGAIHLSAGLAVGGFFATMINFLLSGAAPDRQASTAALYMTVATMMQSVFATVPISLANGLFPGVEGSFGLDGIRFMSVFAIVTVLAAGLCTAAARRATIRDAVDPLKQVHSGADSEGIVLLRDSPADYL
ncbi:MFS transporter [Rhodococcus jostii]|uniref:Major Facilitator Superfamily protein n=1 Tax=Rhodococcus jostii TaxID=132919 RepID=A0A1H4IMC8_RHOJO|nr:MFS transporter [Rhodococcus jostii]SEB35035.1 Major Facilitator Superfamily protein [Rhodococcus jostii]